MNRCDEMSGFDIPLRYQGWEVREKPGTVSTYHDVMCPHGRAVDVINIDDKPITQQHLVDWVEESAAGFRENVCAYRHRQRRYIR